MASQRLRLLVAVGGLLLLTSCKLEVEVPPASALTTAVGLNVDIINGKSMDGFNRPVTLNVLGPDRSFYINQLRFQVNQMGFPAPDVEDWIKKTSEFSVLDWTAMTRLSQEYTLARDGKSYREVSVYGQALWMEQSFQFLLEFVNDADQPVGAQGAIVLTEDQFVMPRKVAMTWNDSQPKKGDSAPITPSYPNLEIRTGGKFTGTADDVYLVQVNAVQGPPLAPPAIGQVTITSARGDSNAAKVNVVSDTPIPLGAAGRGAVITFTDLATSKLVVGDAWIVRCSAATGKVSDPTPGYKTTFGHLAEIRLSVARSNARSFKIPDGATKMKVTWSHPKGAKSYFIPLKVETNPPTAPTDKPGDAPRALDYGLKSSITVSLDDATSSQPRVYHAGDKMALTVDLYDGKGARLHKAGFLPTYKEFWDGTSNGILYMRSESWPAGSGFFAEARTNIVELAVVGPKQEVVQNYSVEPEYFEFSAMLPDIGKVVNGWQSLCTPPVVTIPCAKRDEVWSTPIPNRVSFELPQDARSGTYVAILKVQRSYFGEVTYRIDTVEFQVGGAERTDYPFRVSNCDVCHHTDATLDRLRHGTRDEQTCVACHDKAGGLIAEHLHKIHFYSPLYRQYKNDCSLCHLTQKSNVRTAPAVCGSCHGEVHQGAFANKDPYDYCGLTCHLTKPAGHIPLPPK